MTVVKQLKSMEAWQEALRESAIKPIIIFKYSLTCISSISAIKQMKLLETNLPIYSVIVQTDRDVSNAIEADLGVRHETPQVLIIRERRGVWQATHYKIKNKLVMEAIDQYANGSTR